MAEFDTKSPSEFTNAVVLSKGNGYRFLPSGSTSNVHVYADTEPYTEAELTAREKEYKEKFKEYAEQAGADVDAYVEQVGEDVLKAAILRDAVLDYLVDNCVQVENSDSDADSNSNNKEDSSK